MTIQYRVKPITPDIQERMLKTKQQTLEHIDTALTECLRMQQDLETDIQELEREKRALLFLLAKKMLLNPSMTWQYVQSSENEQDLQKIVSQLNDKIQSKNDVVAMQKDFALKSKKLFNNKKTLSQEIDALSDETDISSSHHNTRSSSIVNIILENLSNVMEKITQLKNNKQDTTQNIKKLSNKKQTLNHIVVFTLSDDTSTEELNKALKDAEESIASNSNQNLETIDLAGRIKTLRDLGKNGELTSEAFETVMIPTQYSSTRAAMLAHCFPSPSITPRRKRHTRNRH